MGKHGVKRLSGRKDGARNLETVARDESSEETSETDSDLENDKAYKTSKVSKKKGSGRPDAASDTESDSEESSLLKPNSKQRQNGYRIASSSESSGLNKIPEGSAKYETESDSSDEEEPEDMDPMEEYMYIGVNEKADSSADAAMFALLLLQYKCDIAFMMPVLLHILSGALQVLLCLHMFLYVLESEEDMYEVAQFGKVLDIMESSMAHNVSLVGDLNKELLGADYNVFKDDRKNFSRVYDWAASTCEKHYINAASTSYITIMVLTLAFGKSISDVSNILWKQYAVSCLSKDSSSMEELDDATVKALDKPPKKTQIGHAHPCVEATSFVFVFLPHILTHMVIACLSAKYICLQASVDKIIKVSLKVYFITKADGFLCKAFISEYFKKLMKKSEYKVEKSYFEKCEGEAWSSWMSTLARLCTGVCMSCVCKFALFKNRYVFANQCAMYFQKFPGEDPMKQWSLGNVTYVGLDWSRPFHS